MVLIEQFFYLSEQKHQKVSSVWRIIPIIIITIGSLSGLIYSTVFGSINLRFAGRCIFFSKFYGKLNNTNNFNNETGIRQQNNSLAEFPFNFLSTYDIQWTSKATCDFMQYTPFLCSLFGIILLTLLFMCGKGGNDVRNGLNKTWRIVIPVLAATILFSVSCLVILKLFTLGLKVFCDDYMKLYGGKSCESTIDKISRAIISDYISVRRTTRRYIESDSDYYEIDNLLYYANTNKLVSVAKLLLIIEMCAWFICVLFLTLRIIVGIDFHLIQFTIRSCEILDYSFLTEEVEQLFIKLDFDQESNEGIDETPDEASMRFSESLTQMPMARSSRAFHSLFGTNENLGSQTQIILSRYRLQDIFLSNDANETSILETNEQTDTVQNKSETIASSNVVESIGSEEKILDNVPSTSENQRKPNLRPTLLNDKTVQFNKSNLETIYSTHINEADEAEVDTETEMVTYSPTHSTVTLASPEPSDDSVELIEYNKESPEKKKKVKKVTIV